MITQASNRPLVIGLGDSIEGYREIHVSLHDAYHELKHWRESDIEVLDNKALICPITQQDSIDFKAGRAYCSVKWLDADGIVHQMADMQISVKKYADHHIMGADEPVTEYDVMYDGELKECKGILNPESIRTAIVIKAGTVQDDVAERVVTGWIEKHKEEIKGEPGEVTYIENPYDDTEVKADITTLQDAFKLLEGKTVIEITDLDPTSILVNVEYANKLCRFKYSCKAETIDGEKIFENGLAYCSYVRDKSGQLLNKKRYTRESFWMFYDDGCGYRFYLMETGEIISELVSGVAWKMESQERRLISTENLASNNANRITALEDRPVGAGYVASDTEPESKDVMWVDTSDNTSDGAGYDDTEIRGDIETLKEDFESLEQKIRNVGLPYGFVVALQNILREVSFYNSNVSGTIESLTDYCDKPEPTEIVLTFENGALAMSGFTASPTIAVE